MDYRLNPENFALAAPDAVLGSLRLSNKGASQPSEVRLQRSARGGYALNTTVAPDTTFGMEANFNPNNGSSTNRGSFIGLRASIDF